MIPKRKINSDDELIWQCQYCSIHNTVWVDFTLRGKQDFIEECRICCRPNRIIVINNQDDNVYIEARPSDE